MPAFFHPPETFERVLVLGVGGGAVIRLLNRFVQPKQIVGVERDVTHLNIARRFFDIGPERACLHCADAVDWLGAYRGDRFDMIVDDLFVGRNGEPERAVDAGTRWFNLLSRNLSADGVLVMNFASVAELRKSAYYKSQTVPRHFQTAFRLSMPLFENSVAAFLRASSDSRRLRRRLASLPDLDPRRPSNRLRFRIQRLHAAASG
jgi:spermidine synthase